MPDQPLNAVGTWGTARFQLDGLPPRDAGLAVPAGIEHLGEFVWDDAEGLQQYWPILEASGPAGQDLPCGRELEIASDQPEHEVVECVGALCASAMVPGTITIPPLEECTR